MVSHNSDVTADESTSSSSEECLLLLPHQLMVNTLIAGTSNGDGRYSTTASSMVVPLYSLKVKLILLGRIY